ncbi:hypothetical protein ACOSQ4_010750 [Xanthoceras sorbifolium]
MDRIAFIFSVQTLDFVSQFVITAWLIWGRRNQFVHSKSAPLQEDVWMKAGQLKAEFESVRAGGCCAPVAIADRNAIWKPLSGNIFKLNVDAAYNKMNQKIGIGLVIRDSSGSIMVAAGLTFRFVFDVELAEVLAILEGIQLALSRGLLPFCVESDALNIVNLCCDSLPVRNDLGTVVHDIRKYFGTADIRAIDFVSRCCNRVAHGIVK